MFSLPVFLFHPNISICGKIGGDELERDELSIVRLLNRIIWSDNSASRIRRWRMGEKMRRKMRENERKLCLRSKRGSSGIRSARIVPERGHGSQVLLDDLSTYRIIYYRDSSAGQRRDTRQDQITSCCTTCRCDVIDRIRSDRGRYGVRHGDEEHYEERKCLTSICNFIGFSI